MKSLRNRIVGLLILAIVTVVSLATFVASRVLQPPSAETTVATISEQIRVTKALVAIDRSAALSAGAVLKQTAPVGERDESLSAALARSLESDGGINDAIVTKPIGPTGAIAAIRLGDREWLYVTLPNSGPPPDGSSVLIGWMLLIVLGSTAVSIYAASKIIGPLELLQSAAGRIGADGVLPHIPEIGSGEVRATAQALNRLSARLRGAMESRMRLVAAAGHDLRTPMTRMRLRAEFVSDEDEREKWLADLAELDAIADSAIGLVREEVASKGVDRIQLDSLVAEVVSDMQKLQFKATITRLESSYVRATPLALKRAVRNLIINAATHGGGATVEVRRSDGTAKIVISDDGPGIPQELLGRVFEPFFRVDGGRRKTVSGGAGLGMAIAKEIIERFGGAIEVANRMPSGLTQIVQLELSDNGSATSGNI